MKKKTNFLSDNLLLGLTYLHVRYADFLLIFGETLTLVWHH